MLSYYANPKNICSKAYFKAMLKPNTSDKVVLHKEDCATNNTYSF